MYLKDPIRLQFELSNVCNLNCIACTRTSENFIGAKESISSPQYISEETFEKIISSPEFKSVQYIEFCGTIDDPAAHPKFLEMIKIIISCQRTLDKRFTVQIHTNGSLRSTAFWEELGQTLTENKINHVVMFNIDGLEDTNHIYRQGSSWTKIMKNAQAFIDAGGSAVWQYIVFPWNEHQVEQAHQLSIEKSFINFFVRQNRSKDTIIQWEESKNTGKQITVWYDQLSDMNDHMQKHSNYSFEQVECPTRNDRMYFIDYKSRLWPCCFIPGAFINDHNKTNHLTQRLFDRYDDSTWNDCSKHTIADVINHRFYKEDLIDSWNSINHDIGNKDRIYVCSQTCNKSELTTNPLGNKSLKII